MTSKIVKRARRPIAAMQVVKLFLYINALQKYAVNAFIPLRLIVATESPLWSRPLLLRRQPRAIFMSHQAMSDGKSQIAE
jgi:hypothetical protein